MSQFKSDLLSGTDASLIPPPRQSSGHDFNSDVGLIMVGGELCTNQIWCNDYTNRTLLSSDGGATFRELAPFPAMSKGHCAVFLDNATLMVIGGNEGIAQYANTTFMLNINASRLNESFWSPGPPISLARDGFIRSSLCDLKSDLGRIRDLIKDKLVKICFKSDPHQT